MFFFNLETAAVNDSLIAARHMDWTAIATAALRQFDRNMAVGEIAEAIQRYVSAQGMPEDLLCATLYQHALKRIDFYSLALAMVQAVEAADSTLMRASEPEDQEELLDEPVSA
jgi:hypothetical protein